MILDAVRAPVRGVAMVAVSAGFLGAFEARLLTVSQDKRPGVLHRYRRRFARTHLAVLGVEIVDADPAVDRQRGPALGGQDNNGLGRVFISNHRSFVDIFVTLGFIEAMHVSRADLGRWPFAGHVATRGGTLYVDRSSKTSRATVVKAMVDAVQRGEGVIVFPEGTTFGGDEVRPLKPGAFAVAEQTGAEIVPVGLAYEDERAIYGDEGFMDHAKRVGAMPKIRVGTAVGDAVRMLEGETRADFQKRCRDLLQNQVDRARAALS